MKTVFAVLVSVALFITMGLVGSLLLLPLAAAAQGIFCIDIQDASKDISMRQHFARYGCGSDKEVSDAGFDNGEANRPGFGYWFTLLHAEFLGVSEAQFKVFLHVANDGGNLGEGLLHIKMVAAYLGKIWFAGWLLVVLFVILPRTDGWAAPQKEMGAVKAVLIGLGFLVASGLAFSILLLPLAAAAQGTFCIDISDESLPLERRFRFADYGCANSEEAKALGIPEDKNLPGFGWWFTLLHAELLGVSESQFKILVHMANDAGNSGEGLLHIKMVAAYLGKIWFGGWLACVLLVILPRTSVQKLLRGSSPAGVEPTTLGANEA